MNISESYAKADALGRLVFISHSNVDKTIADSICAALESEGLSCWIAPRDILPGTPWPEAIMCAIEETRVMVIVVSSHSNTSPQVLREVSLAVHHQLAIIPFRVADISLSKELQYFFSTPHWLDALTPPLEQHIGKLVDSVRAMLRDYIVRAPVLSSNTIAPEASFVENSAEVRLDDFSRNNRNSRLWNWLLSRLDDK